MSPKPCSTGWVDGAVKNKDSETGIALNKAMAEFYNPSERGNSNSAVAQSIKSDQSKSGIQPAIHDEDEDETKRRIREIIRAIEETNDELAAVHAAISASRDPDERGSGFCVGCWSEYCL